MPEKPFSPLYSSIYALVGKIPSGYVSTYGQIARQIGCTARTVGFAMAALPPGHNVPWQRVINSQGKISPRLDGEGNILQRDLLEAEGLQFNQKGRIDLNQYGWLFTEKQNG
ncbi:MGMT family protein [uncultured Desulfuromusa sp.]|uniref:MGMT family protein n=1 Tax=uncultured Desulfuromusa sp. TaxID=219183 RepID=UPI002AA63B8D|nr:MGMT family protein [uncultured Desulfuromusa sp.]